MPERPHEDFLIEEVRERRRQLMADHADDLQKLLETIQRQQAEHPEKVFDLRKLKRARTELKPSGAATGP